MVFLYDVMQIMKIWTWSLVGVIYYRLIPCPLSSRTVRSEDPYTLLLCSGSAKSTHDLIKDTAEREMVCLETWLHSSLPQCFTQVAQGKCSEYIFWETLKGGEIEKQWNGLVFCMKFLLFSLVILLLLLKSLIPSLHIKCLLYASFWSGHLRWLFSCSLYLFWTSSCFNYTYLGKPVCPQAQLVIVLIFRSEQLHPLVY